MVFDSTAGGFTFTGGVVNLVGDIVNNSSAAQTINLPLVLEATNRAFNTASNNLMIGGAIGDAPAGMGLVKLGTNTLTLSGANTYGGDTLISAGTLQLGNAAALGAGAGKTMVSNGATLDLNGQVLTALEPLYLNGAGTNNSGALINSSATAAALPGPITMQIASRVDSGTNGMALSGAINGPGSLTKAGTGILTLAGTNTYAGGTLVTNGGLLANNGSGLATGSGLTTVLAGGTLGGTGFVGTVAIATGATLAPGLSSAVAAVLSTSNLTMDAGATLRVQLGTPLASDKIMVQGDATVNGTVNVAAIGPARPASGTYVVLKATGTLTNNGLVLGSVPPGFAAILVVDSDNGEVRLNLRSNAAMIGFF